MGETAGTADTGLAVTTGDTGALFPPCDTGQFLGQRFSVSRSWVDVERDDGAGEDVWVGDLDGDGLAEVVIGASSGLMYTPAPQSAAFVVAGLPDSGALPQVAGITIAGWRSYDDFGSVVVGLPGSRLVGVGLSAASPEEVGMYFYALHAARQDGTDAVGALHTPGLYGYSDAEDCEGVGGRALLCVSAQAGQGIGSTYLYEAPFNRIIEEADARSVVHGEVGDQAIRLEVGDMDGDGWKDLAVGAPHAAAGAGRIGLVSDPAASEVNLWDAAWATFDGAVQYGELGAALDIGDLNSDGHADLLGGAIGGGPGHAYVFLGPFAGGQSATAAAVTVAGADCYIWTGYSGALADLDGDAEPDLTVAQAQLYAVGGPGRVLGFRGPISGSYTHADADLWIDSPSSGADSDWFGYRMSAADLDGDGLSDLVVSSPRTDMGGPNAGGVHVVLGSSL